MAKEEAIEVEGVVKEALPNTMFRVELSNKLVGNPDPSKELPGVGSKLKVLYRMPTHKFHYPAK